MLQISAHLSLLTKKGPRTEPLGTPLASGFWRVEVAGRGNCKERAKGIGGPSEGAGAVEFENGELGIENCPVLSTQLASQVVLSNL